MCVEVMVVVGYGEGDFLYEFLGDRVFFFGWFQGIEYFGYIVVFSLNYVFYDVIDYCFVFCNLYILFLLIIKIIDFNNVF